MSCFENRKRGRERETTQVVMWFSNRLRHSAPALDDVSGTTLIEIDLVSKTVGAKNVLHRN